MLRESDHTLDLPFMMEPMENSGYSQRWRIQHLDETQYLGLEMRLVIPPRPSLLCKNVIASSILKILYIYIYIHTVLVCMSMTILRLMEA